MRLLDLDRLGSFALLGPGFGGDPFLLLSGLRETRSDPVLAYASFESPGADALRYAAGERRQAAVEIDPRRGPSGRRCGTRVTGRRSERSGGDRLRRRLPGLPHGEGGSRCGERRRHPRGPLRRGRPRFAAWVRLPGGEEFVSASPELFFETEGSRIHAEPMKGTARGDAAASLEMSAKDRAELAMITDLLRNDLAPICRPRSVRVENERR